MKKKSNSILQSALTKLQHGESCRNVAKELKISITTAQRIRNSNKENIPLPKRGRPSKVTKASHKVLVREFDTGQLETIEEG
jgi:transposase